MPTRRGITLVALSCLLWATGRLLGVVEFEYFALSGITLVFGALVFVQIRRFDVAVGRTLSPLRVFVDTPVTVTVRLYNQHRFTSPPLVIRDHVDRWGQARYLAGPVPPRRSLDVHYSAPSHRRGRLTIGPMELACIDPFGLAVRAKRIGTTAEVVVFPRIYPVIPITGAESSLGPMANQRFSPFNSGDDLSLVRPYVEGEDPRRIHWASSARANTLMVRAQEPGIMQQLTVVLDSREEVHSPASFESAVSAVASVLNSSVVARQPVRLLTTNGFSTSFGSSQESLNELLEYLAETTTSKSPISINPDQLSTPTGTTVIVSTTAFSTADLISASPKQHRNALLLTVLFARSSGERTNHIASGAHNVSIVVGPNELFASAWNTTLGYKRLPA